MSMTVAIYSWTLMLTVNSLRDHFAVIMAAQYSALANNVSAACCRNRVLRQMSGMSARYDTSVGLA